MSDDHVELVRLPGLFRWREVCDVFDQESGRDVEWRFEVRRTSGDDVAEALYTVYAWCPGGRTGNGHGRT